MPAVYILRRMPRYDLGFELLEKGISKLESHSDLLDETYPLFVTSGPFSSASPRLFGVAKNKTEAEKRLYGYIKDWIEGHAIKSVDDQTGLAAKLTPPAIPA